MRGKVYAMGLNTLGARITPAYAGKSVYDDTAAVWCEDHPRVCGEKLDGRSLLVLVLGSPPRMRGKALHFQQTFRHSRITPAYAGKRSRQASCRCRPGDHPRVCGEKTAAVISAMFTVGSPPRMRGKDRVQGEDMLADGITPAYAGKRAASSPPCPQTRDHPRVCGEKTKKIP